ncbi:MAG: site-specific DNA-methyltransferase [Anaerovoracaceae bacterium]
MQKKLELTWYGKDEPIKVEPRLLIEDSELSYGDEDTENMLIHGDNLLALKALESKYAGQVKCIYIDPPYNTGNAFEHYDDNKEHSIWLNLMKPRLEILNKLLSENGSIYVQIDNAEQAYLKVLLDEIFGRKNFVQMISVKRASPAGFKVINPGPLTVTEYIMLYSKNKEIFHYSPQRIPVAYDKNYNMYITNKHKNPKEWEIRKLTEVLYKKWGITKWQEARDRFGSSWKSIRDSALGELAIELKESVVSVRDPHKPTEKIKKVMQESKNDRSRVFVIEREKYDPIYIYNGGSLSFYKDKLREINGQITPTELLTDFWVDINYAGIANEGGTKFKNSKKPEMLVERVMKLATNPGDLVLDSFLGSGTTAAVAHKMGRKWIGIEMGDHAYTHCKVRLDKVIDGKDKAGITKSAGWEKGGGYKFYELAPSLINKDSYGEFVINKDYSPDMLAAAVALHEGFKYQPSNEVFWKQSMGNEKSFLLVTTTHLTEGYLNSIHDTMQEGEYLVIACKSYDSGIEKIFKNIAIKKIPNMLLSKCEFNKNDYDLNIVSPPIYADDEAEENFILPGEDGENND